MLEEVDLCCMSGEAALSWQLCARFDLVGRYTCRSWHLHPRQALDPWPSWTLCFFGNSCIFPSPFERQQSLNAPCFAKVSAVYCIMGKREETENNKGLSPLGQPMPEAIQEGSQTMWYPQGIHTIGLLPLSSLPFDYVSFDLFLVLYRFGFYCFWHLCLLEANHGESKNPYFSMSRRYSTTMIGRRYEIGYGQKP